MTLRNLSNQVNLTIMVRGVDYNLLVAQSSLHEQFTSKLKSVVMDSVRGDVSEDDVLVTLSPGSVKACVAIRAHAADDTLAIRTKLEDPAVQSALKENIAQSVAAMDDVHLISNGRILRMETGALDLRINRARTAAIARACAVEVASSCS